MSRAQDKLIGWLRRMAKLPRVELIAGFSTANRDLLAQLVDQCVPTQLVPQDLAAADFPAWIYGLAESERDWSRALGNTLLRVDEYAVGSSAAIDLLSEFARQCPWVPLREIAEGEAQRHGGHK